jgi:ABC-type sugar transport system ATPase subunit
MPEAISGGERQRVALARALVRSPSVFLLDEPLSSLDAQLRVSMRTEIRELQRRIGVTTLLVTHDQTEALTMGDRVCVMRDGVAHQSGTPDDVYNRPSDRYVATFLGSPAMNVVSVAFDEGVLVAGPFRLPLSPEQREACEANGGSIELGVRPEHVVLGGAGGDPVSHAGAVVALAEMAGAETFLHLDAEGRRVVVRAPSPATGSVSIEREPQRAYVFDSADGRTLLAWEPQR